MIDVRALFPAERGALLDLLRSFEPSDWVVRTACPGWDVHDLATHLLGDDLGRLARTRDGYAGVAPRDGERLPAFLDRINDEWVVAARRISPHLLIGLLRDMGREIDRLWGSIDLTGFGEPVTWASPDPAPRWLDAARDYTEYWVHQQQIREATGRDGLTEPGFLRPVIDTFMRALPRTLREAPVDDGARVTFQVTGPAGGSWSVVRTDGAWRFEDPAGAPTARVTLNQDTTWRLCTRGCSPAHARSQATLDGDEELGSRALTIVSIIHPDLDRPGTGAEG
jgi:uncharacterized protein (TIGR03083 family)